MNNSIQEITQIWSEALVLLAPKLSLTSYDVWIKNLTPVQLAGDRFYLMANLEMTRNAVASNYLDIITEAVQKVHPYVHEVVVFCANEAPSTPANNLMLDEVLEKKPSFIPTVVFDECYTFDSFVVGGSNEIAYHAAKAVAETPGKLHNPLFVYGGVGLGKTHIVHAIGNQIMAKSPRTKIIYVTTEKFTNDYIDSLKGSPDDIKLFREKYRNVDVLMMDDIQFISGKVSTQEALFHTFNDLYQSKKQVVFTSDCHPKDLNNLEDRLKSRFQSGLTVDISYPDLETRIAILAKKAFQKKFRISSEVINYIAERVDKNIRELEGALNKVMFFCSLNNLKADSLDLVAMALKDDISSSVGAITIEQIVSVVCNYFSIDRKEIIGKKKTKQLAEARQIAIYVICEHLSMPLTAIGKFFGGRDYSTMIHARDKITALVSSDAIYRNYVSDIENLIKSNPR